MRRLATNILTTAMLIVLFTASARSQGAEEIDARNAGFVQLYGQGKYAEAAATAEETVAKAEQMLGREHPQTLASITSLASAYRALGRYAEAEPLYLRALAAFERVAGAEHPDTLASTNNLVEIVEVTMAAPSPLKLRIEGKDRVARSPSMHEINGSYSLQVLARCLSTKSWERRLASCAGTNAFSCSASPLFLESRATARMPLCGATRCLLQAWAYSSP